MPLGVMPATEPEPEPQHVQRLRVVLVMGFRSDLSANRAGFPDKFTAPKGCINGRLSDGSLRAADFPEPWCQRQLAGGYALVVALFLAGSAPLMPTEFAALVALKRFRLKGPTTCRTLNELHKRKGLRRAL